MQKFQPLREVPLSAGWKSQDVLVVFGELFSRGYVNGLVDEAKKIGMKVVYSTVGRRDELEKLRPLNAAELKEAASPLINVPLEAGFDMTPALSGRTPCQQLEGLRLSEWSSAKLNWTEINESMKAGREHFLSRVEEYFKELESQIPPTANVLFVHTMAGGVPRAKIVMPAMNRVFKGHGDRYASSEEFWGSDLGRFCSLSFMEVTANTFQHFIDLSRPLRAKIEARGQRAAYVAYGYHGTEVLNDGNYRWQSYSPYLQGFAKLELENVARRALAEGVKASVYNAPEILTNSSSIFLGVEVALYPLLGALQKEGGAKPQTRDLINSCIALLKPEHSLKEIMDFTSEYFNSETIRRWSDFPAWPQHNGPEQMSLMREASTRLIQMHKDPKNMITSILSEVVFRACGKAMLMKSWEPQESVWWVGHDLVAKLSEPSR
jgi:hypothetical protein